MKVVLASNNAGKIKEFSELLYAFPFSLVSQNDCGVKEIEETGLSFVENALQKARHASHETDLPALSDDSGLVVEALDGAPGIYSARYASKSASARDNIERLLSELAEVPDEKRNAFFYCTIVFLSHDKDPTPLICQGKWEGKILTSPRGNEGFGYDPIFYVPSLQKTAAEISLSIKNKISHRGIAMQSLLTLLTEK